MPMSPRRRRLWEFLIAIAASVLIFLLVLIGAGILTLPTAPPATVTVTAAQWRIIEGTSATGLGWFGPSTLNSTAADGFPYTVSSGGVFTLDRLLSNGDDVNHTIYLVTVQPPFTIGSFTPGTPFSVPSGEDDFVFSMTLVAPTVGSSESFSTVITLDAMGPT